MVVRLRTRLKIIALLFAVPLGMAITVLCQAQGLQPYYDGIATYDYDPTYTYLMGGLSVLKGEIPAFADHPGTLTHILVALAIALASSFPWWSELPVDSCQSQVCFVFDYPEVVLRLAGWMGLGLWFFAIGIFGWTLYRYWRLSVAETMVCQAVFLSAPLLLLYGFVVNGETVGVPMVLLSFSALIASRDSEGWSSWLMPFLAGVALAGCLLAKLNFLPFVLLLLLLREPRRFALASLSWFGSVLWLGHRFTRWDGWQSFWGAVTRHQGNYGSGVEGFLDASRSVERVQDLSREFPLVFVLAILSLMLWVLLWRRPKRLGEKASISVRRLLQESAVLGAGCGLLFTPNATDRLRLALIAMSLALFARLNARQPWSTAMESKSIELQIDATVLLLIFAGCLAGVLKHFDPRYMTSALVVSAMALALCCRASATVDHG